ncbi:beta-galactosidase 15-like [Tasmannia lanceolata]|uniref:beta-galactosidase 15-like n=1 Tax=Tasmannia lanceolata TaxID=3420 RepID=UPI0040645BD6
MRIMGYLVFFLIALAFLCSSPTSATEVTYDGRAIIIDGQRRVLLSGSIHYPRSTPEMWPDLIQKAKDGGLDAIETYVFWDVHEPRRREYNFEGSNDIIRFIKTVQDAGLYVVLRIGPYVTAEWSYGGFPVWLHNMPGIQLRTDNEIYKNEMQIFTTLIVNMMKQEDLLAPQGGPIIITQIENEYGNVQSSYGEPGKKYLEWCAKMADSLNVGVPWIMCQQSDAPQPMINTCNGWYCDSFKPNRPNSPKMWTENWTGWFKAWGDRNPHRAAEDVAYSAARFFQEGGTFQNYYMYHGGTNFGRTAGGPYITTSYDYDAPLDEYGNLKQPKWGHLKLLHDALHSMENVLTHGDVTTTDFENGAKATIYTTTDGNSSCFLSNTNTTVDRTLNFQGNSYFVPAWSVSVLPDCKKEVYNTAKVNTQTSLMVKKPNMAEDEPEILNWTWRPEHVKDTLMGHGAFAATKLLEQISTTVDTSDYLWYMTSVKISKKDPAWSDQMILRVNTTGHVLHAFVNGKLIGSQYAQNGEYKFVFEAPVRIKPSLNHITLLSATVGLTNYGPYFDLVPAGIVGGPVQLVGKGNNTKDLSLNKWSYKIGLNGEHKELYSQNSPSGWFSNELVIFRPMSWYQTTFKAPLGEEPVVVDLKSMRKGNAWVNGQSIGRYWSNFTAPADGCNKCDYRGPYSPSKCTTGCGQPTQRWYHIPRSFLKTDQNTLTLFEEMGGNPTLVNFQTVTVGTACASVSEGDTLELSCQGDRTISKIEFASYGDAQGTCGSFEQGTCEADNILSLVQKECVGKMSCSIDVSDAVLGSSKCSNSPKRLVVQAIC